MSDKKFICKFCNKVLSSSGSLSNHVKKSKKCISQRKQNKVKVKKTKENFSCEYCPKVYTTKQSLNYHMKTHDKEIEKDRLLQEKDRLLQEKDRLLQEYKQQIRELQDKLENIAIKASTKPTTINQNRNTYIQNNLKPLREEDFTKHLEHFTQDTILDGYEGIGKYALEYPLRDKVICVDFSRKMIKYKNDKGELVDDPEMTKICQKFFASLKDKSKEIKDNFSEDNDMVRESFYDRILETNKEIRFIGDGYDTKLRKDFIRYICNRVKV